MFSLKYVLLTSVLTAILVCIFEYSREHVTITVDIKSERKKISYRLPAVLYAFVLFLLNVIRIFDNNFWGDECFSIRLAKMSIPEMLKATAEDVHPPLYYLLMMGGYRIFGENGWAFHMVSILPYAIMLIFIMTAVWKKFGGSAAVFMVTLVSIMESPVHYNVEVRMYSLASLFMLLAYYAFYLIITEGKRTSYVYFVLASLGAAYTHYYAMMSVAFLYLALLVMFITKRIKLWKVLTVYAATIVGYMPWLLSMLKTFMQTSKGYWMTEIPTLKDCLLYFFKSEKNWYSYIMLLVTIVPVAVITLMDTGIITAEKKEDNLELKVSRATDRTSDLGFWLLWGVITSFGVIAIGELISHLIQPAFSTTYIYPVTSIMWLVFSVGISRFPGIKKIGVPVLLVITLLICVPQYISSYKEDKRSGEECSATYEFLKENVSVDDVILTNKEHLEWTVFEYYLPGVESEVVTGADETIETGKSYWVVWSTDLSDENMRWLDNAGYEPTEVYHAGVLGTYDIHVYKLEKK